MPITSNNLHSGMSDTFLPRFELRPVSTNDAARPANSLSGRSACATLWHTVLLSQIGNNLSDWLVRGSLSARATERSRVLLSGPLR